MVVVVVVVVEFAFFINIIFIFMNEIQLTDGGKRSYRQRKNAGNQILLKPLVILLLFCGYLSYLQP